MTNSQKRLWVINRSEILRSHLSVIVCLQVKSLPMKIVTFLLNANGLFRPKRSTIHSSTGEALCSAVIGWF